MGENDNGERATLSKEDQAKLEALRQALIEGEQSGEPTPFDFDTFFKEMHARREGKNKK